MKIQCESHLTRNVKRFSDKVTALDSARYWSGKRYAGKAAQLAMNQLKKNGRKDVPKLMIIIKMGPSSDRLEPQLKRFQEKGVKTVLISAFPESQKSKYSDTFIWSHIKVQSIAQLMQYQPIIMDNIFSAIIPFPLADDEQTDHETSTSIAKKTTTTTKVTSKTTTTTTSTTKRTTTPSTTSPTTTSTKTTTTISTTKSTTKSTTTSTTTTTTTTTKTTTTTTTTTSTTTASTKTTTTTKPPTTSIFTTTSVKITTTTLPTTTVPLKTNSQTSSYEMTSNESTEVPSTTTEVMNKDFTTTEPTTAFEEKLQYTTTSSSVLSTSFDVQSTVQPSDSISETYPVSSNTESTFVDRPLSEVTTESYSSPIETSTVQVDTDSVETTTAFDIYKNRPELILNISTGSFDTTTDSEMHFNTTAVYEDTSLALEPTSKSTIETTKEQTTENMGQVTFFSTAATSVEHTDASSEPNKKTFPILTSTNKAEVTTAAPNTNILNTTTIEQFDNNESSGGFASGDGVEIELDTDDEDLIGRHQSSRVIKSTAPVIVVTTRMPTETESTTKSLLESSTAELNNFTSGYQTSISKESPTTPPRSSTEQATMSQTDITSDSFTETSTRSTRSSMSTASRSLNNMTTIRTNENLASTESHSKSYETDTESTTSSSFTTNSDTFISSTENQRKDLTMMLPFTHFFDINHSHSNLILNLGQV